MEKIFLLQGNQRLIVLVNIETKIPWKKNYKIESNILFEK